MLFEIAVRFHLAYRRTECGYGYIRSSKALPDFVDLFIRELYEAFSVDAAQLRHAYAELFERPDLPFKCRRYFV